MDKFKQFTKYFWLLFAFLIVGAFLPFNSGQAKVQPYYSGDAVYYQGKIIIGSTDTGFLELFKYSNNKLERVIKLKNYNQLLNSYENFSDLKFSVENNHLYVYTTSGYTVYKYDFSDISSLTLLSSSKNTFWNWYHRVDRYGDYLGLVSDNGVQIINNNLESIDNFSFLPVEKYSLRSNGSNKYLFGVSDAKIQIYDRSSRSIIKEIPMNLKDSNPNHKIYFDSIDNTIYAVDDYYAKKFNLNGQVLGSFRHLDAPGYDMESSAGNLYVYFSNGLGVVKMRKDNFKIANYAFTSNLVAPQGWAMGLKLVATDNGDRLIVFNASNIVILDSKLKKLASILANQVEPDQPVESLYLNLDHPTGVAGAEITLLGGGFWSNENLRITFGGSTKNVFSNVKGAFNTKLIVPDLTPRRLDIKVIGVNSKLTYSIAFEIK